MWRKRRALSYLMHNFDDYQSSYQEEQLKPEELAAQASRFFWTKSELIQPAKAYFVAIIYAALLERYFHIPFYRALSQPDLLKDDKWYRSYLEAKDIYDAILESIPKNFLDMPSTQKTRDYFKEEFLIGADSQGNPAL